MTAGRIAKITIYSTLGIAFMAAFSVGIVMPVSAASVLFFLVAVTGAAAARGTPLVLLPRLFVVLYALPYGVCLFYIFDPHKTWMAHPEGVAVVYQIDMELVAEMIAFGMVGLLGLLLGFELAGSRGAWDEAEVSHRSPDSIPLPFALVMVLGAMAAFLSWLSAPTETLLQSAYAAEGTQARSLELHLASAYLISYGLLVGLAIDLERETRLGVRKVLKILVLASVTLYIVLYLQLLRGDRESMGLLTGLCVLFLTAGAARFRPDIAWRRVRLLAFPLVLVGLVYVTMGAARFITTIEQNERNVVDVVQKGFELSTWTAVLLTNLGAAAEYHYGTIDYLMGETYVDYVLSLPPGIVASAIGFERPVDLSRGPNYWYRGLASGGMHAAVVPFKNFGIIGPFVLMAAFGFLIARIDMMNVPGKYWRRLTFAMTATASFFWFWYGDMNFIRAMMIVVVVGVLDRMGVFLVATKRERSPAD